jgi:hypothetical protein
MRSQEETEMRLPGLRLVVVLGGLVASIGWAQRVRGGLELWIGIPVRTESDSVEVAYSINAGQFHTYTMSKAKPTFGNVATRLFVIEAGVNRIAADRVRAVVFIPGCKTSSLDVAFHGKSLSRDVQCARLSHWTLKGQMVEAAVAKTGSLKVDVAYKANWVSNFLEPAVDQLPLFDVATTSVSKNGSFSLELPILALDPAEESAKGEDRGELLFTLKNGETGDTLGTLQPDKFATPSGGLELRTEYPRLQFELER